MEKRNSGGRPEVYALRQEGGDWKISRRDFLKAAGAGAAAVSTGLNSGCSRQENRWTGPAESLDVLCPQVTAHDHVITQLLVTSDGKYLVSNDRHDVKCWDFRSSSLLQSYNLNASRIVVCNMGGKNSVIRYSSDPSSVTGSFFTSYKIPDSKKSDADFHPRTSYSFKDFAVDASGNIYTVNDAGVHFLSKESSYEREETLYSFQDYESNPSCTLLKDDRELFIRKNKGFGILDLETGELKHFDGGCTGYSIFPDGSKALIFSGLEYRLVSLENGETLWARTVSEIRDGEDNELFVQKRTSGGYYVRCSLAVTPDGSTGILLGEKGVCLVSLSDGSLIRYMVISGDPDDGVGCVAVAGDGSRAAVSVSKAILFLSLPDLEILGCPIDLNEVKDDVSGVEISMKDPDTGKKIQYTMPCGAAIPDGAVCTCNCVAGKGGCACDSHGKSNGSSYGGPRHYWHPN